MYALMLAEKPVQSQVRESLELFVNSDPKMSEMWHEALLAALNPRPTLVIGDVGVGKERMTRAIAQMWQKNAGRSTANISVMNITAINESLLESELFGHVKGAYTGAHADRSGEFEARKNGVVVLDEIGDLSLALQSKILRVIEEPYTFRKVGSNDDLIFDGKIIASTHQNLSRMADEGEFRNDLLSRLSSGGVIRVPRLSERSAEHVSRLIEFFAEKIQVKMKRALCIPEETKKKLLSLEYPNNVRDLRDTVEQACIRTIAGERNFVSVEDIVQKESKFHALKESFADAFSDVLTLKQRVAEVEKKEIRRALIQFGFVKTTAAESLGISVGTLTNKMKKLGLTDYAYGQDFISDHAEEKAG